MFQFQEKLKRLDIPAKNVLRLQRSLGDVQVALPGLKAQRATAYVIAFSVEQGLRVAIAFHLRDSDKVVYYLNGAGNLTRKEIGAVLNEGVVFTETLGFMLTDLDIHQADPQERNALWESLPLKNPPQPAAPKPQTETKVEASAAGEKSQQPAKQAVKVEATVEVDEAMIKPPSDEEIALGLPRSQALAAMRRKKQPPTAEELQEKRKRLRENLGRFLSSM